MNKENDFVNKNYGKDFQNHLLEQYKLYVETTNKISDRRQTTNNFYLTLNSAIFALSGYLSVTLKDFWILYTAFLGILISIFWIQNINSYRQLNSSKFDIIHEMEKHLPAFIFKTEWDFLKKRKSDRYKELTAVEKNIPKIFILLYAGIIVVHCFLFLIPFY